MSRFREVIIDAADSPVEAIQIIIAFTVLILAIYVALPWYIPSTGTATAVAFADNWIQQSIVGAIMFLPTLPILAGLFSHKYATIKWYTRSTLLLFTVLLFIMLLRVIAIGVFPLTWLPTLALAFIIGICHLYWKAKKYA